MEVVVDTFQQVGSGVYLKAISATAYVALYMLFFNFEKSIFGDPWRMNEEMKAWPIKSVQDFWELLERQMGQILCYIISLEASYLESTSLIEKNDTLLIFVLFVILIKESHIYLLVSQTPCTMHEYGAIPIFTVTLHDDSCSYKQ